MRDIRASWIEKGLMKIFQNFSTFTRVYMVRTGNAHSFIKVMGSITVPSTSWKTGLDMTVVDINKNFLKYNLVRPAFWEVDSTWSFPLLLRRSERSLVRIQERITSIECYICRRENITCICFKRTKKFLRLKIVQVIQVKSLV